MKKQIATVFIICGIFFSYGQANLAPISQNAAPIPSNALTLPNEKEPQQQPDPEKFAALFPKIEGATDKIGVPFWKEYWLAILVSVITVVVIVAFIFRPKRTPKISPKERALTRVKLTRARSVEMSEKTYALEISQAVRDYIEDKHSLPAPERTTQEFLKIAAESFDDTSNKILDAILNLSDMAKFARQSFKDDEREELAKLAEQFIEEDDAKFVSNEKIVPPSADVKNAEKEESTSK